MATVVSDFRQAKTLPALPWGELPPKMRLLFVAGRQRTGAWLAEAFTSDSVTDITLVEAPGMAIGLTRVRDDVFDAILVSHEPGCLDALEMIEAIRAGNGDQMPVIVLGNESEQELAALCYEVGADAYVCVHTATTRALIWQIARSIEHHQLIAENARLKHARRHRLELEHDEAERLLDQQRQLVAKLEGVVDTPAIHDGIDFGGESSPETAAGEGLQTLPEALVDHYRELLRAYVIMGSGNLSQEMNRLAELLTAAGITAQQAMLLHINVLEEMVRTLGNRSARHVMSRADILILEVILHLAEGYRQRYFDRIQPQRQLTLPGFDEIVSAAFGE